MRAIVITKPGGPEVMEEQDRPRPEPGFGQIRVHVRASALNRADLMQRRGTYPPPAGAPPDIPGMEYAGEVDALGPGTSLWSPGSRVMGIIGGGGHAEYLCVHEREAMPVPANLSWEEAAAIPEAFLTAHDAIFHRLDVQTGERLLIHAVGSGVGTAALQLALVAGITVLGTSRSPAKLAKARELGLAIGIDTSRDDWLVQIAQVTDDEGVNAVLDLVGGNFLAGNITVLAQRGRLVLVGLTAGARAELNLAAVLAKRLQIVGTVLRARPLEEKIAIARGFSSRVLPLFESGRLRPVIDRVFSFAEIGAAHELMESNGTFGKVVLRWE
jgi:putative PIG3 family NAD(P)H quinone oxidoreductase